MYLVADAAWLCPRGRLCAAPGAPGVAGGLGRQWQELGERLQETAAPGALGRFTSVMVLHPLDTFKTRAQVVSSASRRTVVTAVYRAPGVFGGAGAAILGQIANAMLTCAGYELWKEWSKGVAPGLDSRTRTVLSAVMGDITGHLLLAPAEVVKVQMQLRLHRSLPAAAGAVLRQGPGMWYRGYGGLLLRDVPYRALQIVLFEEFARMYMAHTKASYLNINEMLATGAAAGCAAGDARAHTHTGASAHMCTRVCARTHG